MLQTGLNPVSIRIVLIVLFVVITQVLRAAKRSRSSKPTPQAHTAKTLPEGTLPGEEVLRDFSRQEAKTTPARRSGSPENGETLEVNGLFQQPPSTEPESSFIPSLLLLALVACLCLMAYRHWAG